VVAVSFNRKTGFYANRDLNTQEVGLIFEVFSNIQE
jgi:hypothetical protein